MYLFLIHLASHSLSLPLDFTEFRPVLAYLMSSTLKLLLKLLFISDLIMPKLVYLMTVHEAHQEYNSLIDQIRAKYELLDSGECGSVGTPAFNAECSDLAHLMARMSELCKHLNLHNAQGTSQAPTIQALNCSKF